MRSNFGFAAADYVRMETFNRSSVQSALDRHKVIYSCRINCLDRRISAAPMMDWTDRHCRYFLRGFSPRVLLYTEMITAAAIEHGHRDRLLKFSP